MKNKLGIFTALILSLVIAGSAFASPGTVSINKAAKAKVSNSAAKKKKKHHRHTKRKMMKKSSTMTTTPDKTSK